MAQQGNHTWNIAIHYHRCPFCGYVMESRTDFQYRMGKNQKDLVCPRCKQRFTVTKCTKPRFGPLLGNPERAEMEWDD